MQTVLDPDPFCTYSIDMNKTKRPTIRLRDTVTVKNVIPAYDGKPWVLSDTALTVSSVTGTGSTRNPYRVVVTDGAHFWHLEPDDLQAAA